MLNKVMLIGNLGADPEIRHMASGDPVTTLKIATTRKWKDKNGEKQEETEWHRVTFFGALAKVAGDYLQKGAKIYIEGRIKTDKYQKDGRDVYSTGIIGESLQMLGSRDSQPTSKPENKPNRQPENKAEDFDDIPF